MATDVPRIATFPPRKPVHLRAVPSPDRARTGPAGPRRLTASRPRPVGVPTPASARRAALTARAAVDEAVTTALDSLDLIEGCAQEAADAFRWNHIGEACRRFGDLIRSTRLVLELAAQTAGASGTALQAAFEAGEPRADEEMHDVVNHLIECHMAEDWTALADTLEHDFLDALAHWRRVFEALRRSDSTGGDAA